MARINLLGGTYQARSIIADDQLCLNLYPEENQKDNEVPITCLPTPGLTLLANPPVAGQARCEYRASDGTYYRVVGSNIYAVTSSWVHTLVGTIGTSYGIVSMSDNGLVIIVVDGTANGYCIDMTTITFGTITSNTGAFYGANKVDFLDTFFIFNRPGTSQFYSSLSNVTSAMLIAGTAFDPLYIAAKTGSPDFISTLAVMHLEIWLIGTLTTEIWYDAGTADFPFGRLPGTFIEHGTASTYGLAKHDLALFWLVQDREGNREFVMGADYRATRISNHGVEYEINKYSTVSDMIGFCYQQEGHTFYVAIFPTANTTWVFDKTTGLWHKRAWCDNNGVLNRIRANCAANVFGIVVIGDWQTGALYQFDLNNYTDNGQPIPRIRRFKHLLEGDAKVKYPFLILDMEPGNGDPAQPTSPISIRWSDDRGKTYGNPIIQTLGAIGAFNTSIKISRLGIARDRVYEVSWSLNSKTSLQGAWLATSITGN